MTEDAGLEAARRLRDLALEYIERSRDAQAELVRSFEVEAASISRLVGDVAVEDDDDERLTLTAAGRFHGSVLDDQTNEWRTLEVPDDVVDFYDPVDLFDDLVGAIEDAFPGVVDDTGDDVDGAPAAATSGSGTPSVEPWLERMAHDQADPPGESATLTTLRHLHEAGVLSDADFAARKAELEPH